MSTDLEVEDRLAAREFFASALYMALVLLAVLVAVPTERLPPDDAVVGLLLGSAIGLTLAHWLAFRLAAHLTDAGGFAAESAAREAAAQIGGGWRWPALRRCRSCSSTGRPPSTAPSWCSRRCPP